MRIFLSIRSWNEVWREKRPSSQTKFQKEISVSRISCERWPFAFQGKTKKLRYQEDVTFTFKELKPAQSTSSETSAATSSRIASSEEFVRQVQAYSNRKQTRRIKTSSSRIGSSEEFVRQVQAYSNRNQTRPKFSKQNYNRPVYSRQVFGYSCGSLDSTASDFFQTSAGESIVSSNHLPKTKVLFALTTNVCGYTDIRSAQTNLNFLSF